MMPYQSQAIAVFLKMLPSGCTRILEIGSDIGGEVLSTMAIKTRALVVGVNPATDFPGLVKLTRSFPVRGDGRFLPFSDGSFDAVLSIATMEHVNGIELLLAEITRVLKNKGLFYTTFEPIWSSGQGHHIYAKVGEKEARF